MLERGRINSQIGPTLVCSETCRHQAILWYLCRYLNSPKAVIRSLDVVAETDDNKHNVLGPICQIK